MTLHLEEFPLSKLTTVSLCDSINSLGNTSQKATRNFDITESLLHTRNNSYTKKVHKACNLKKESLGIVTLTKGIVDHTEVLKEIKEKLSLEISEVNTRFLNTILLFETAHNKYFANNIVITHYELQYAFNLVYPGGEAEELDYPEGVALYAQLPEYYAYRDSKIQTLDLIKDTLAIEFKKFKDLHNTHIGLELKRRKEINTLTEKYVIDAENLNKLISEATSENRTSLVEQLNKLIKTYDETILNLKLTNIQLNKEEAAKEVLVLNKYKDLQMSLMFQDINPETRLGELYSYYIYYLTLIGKNGISGLTDVLTWSSIFLNKLSIINIYYLSVDPSWSYVLFPALKYFTIVKPLFDTVGILIPQSPNKDNEPKIDIVAYQDPDANFYNTMHILDLNGHPSLNVESNRFYNPRQLLEVVDVSLDENNPLLNQTRFELRSGIESLEYLLPEHKVYHIGYKFKLENTFTYGYITSDVMSSKTNLNPKELDFKFIPYTPIKLQNTSLAKDKRLSKASLYFEEFLRNLYIPYYNLDTKLTKLGLAEYKVSTSEATLNYTLNDVISNAGINIGVPINSESEAVCKYLTYLFSKILDPKDKEGFDKWKVGIKGTNANNIDEFSYLYENSFSFKSEMSETIIGYSYIEQEEKEGTISKAESNITKGTNTKINYNNTHRLLQNGINILIPGSLTLAITTHIHGNNLYYDDSKLIIKVSTGKNKYTITTVYGFTHTFIVNGSVPLTNLESSWLVEQYNSTYNTKGTYKYKRTIADIVRTTFGVKTNEDTDEVLTVKLTYKKDITVAVNTEITTNPINIVKIIKPKDNINISIPLIYFDIRDKNSDYYKLNLINTIESVFFDSIQLQIICTIFDEQDTELDPKLRSKLLYTYLYFFLDPKLDPTIVDASADKFNQEEANRNRVYNTASSGSYTANYKESGISYIIDSDYRLFRTNNYVGIGLTYYNTIPTRNVNNNLNPIFLEYQFEREYEVKNMLTQGTTLNLYQDKNSHINNAITGLYKPIVLIEPLIKIGDTYKKPMFNQ